MHSPAVLSVFVDYANYSNVMSADYYTKKSYSPKQTAGPISLLVHPLVIFKLWQAAATSWPTSAGCRSGGFGNRDGGWGVQAEAPLLSQGLEIWAGEVKSIEIN